MTVPSFGKLFNLRKDMAALYMVVIKYMQITLKCLTVFPENTYLKHISGPSFFLYFI